jgi:4-hydroxybutyrate CoA-transferase
VAHTKTTKNWETEYSSKLQTPDQALRYLKSGMRVYIHPGCAELIEAMMRRAPELNDVEITHMRTMGKAPYVARK